MFIVWLTLLRMSRAQALAATAYRADGAGSMRLLGSAACPALSAVEDRPADSIAPALVVKDELSNRLRELLALPLALQPASAFDLALRRGRTHGLDGVGGRTEFMGGDVRDRRCLTRSVGGMASRPAQLSCGGIGGARC